MHVEFEGILIKDEEVNGYYCEVPFDVEQRFGKKRVKIVATIDSIIYRGLLTPMCGVYRVMLNKEIREKVGKKVGDTVQIHIKEDTEPREVTIPEDLQSLLEKEDMLTFFEKLSFTHQKEYVQWIEGAKRAETRQNRLMKAIEMMQKGIKSR